MDEGAEQMWAERAVRAVNKVFPEVEYSAWQSCSRLIPHAQSLAHLIDEFGFDFLEAARMLNQAGYYLTERAQYEEAEPLLRRALTIREKTLGAEHPNVAIVLENYASFLRAMGKSADAMRLEGRASTIRRKYSLSNQ